MLIRVSDLMGDRALAKILPESQTMFETEVQVASGHSLMQAGCCLQV